MARGHRVLALAVSGPRPGEEAPGQWIAVRARGGLSRGGRERRLAAALLDAAAEHRCELTLGIRHLPRADLYWPHGGLHRETLRLLGKRARGRHRAFLELEDAALSGGAGRILCVSELVRREILRHHPAAAERLALVPNGVDLERFHPGARGAARAELEARGLASRGEPLVLFLGRNPGLKGLPLLLAALGRLGARPWRLLVAGVPAPRVWAARARAAGLPRGRVRVVAELEPRLALAGADLLVLPTRRDPCPLVVLEALASGTPVVTTERAGSADAIGSEAAGAVLPGEPSADELARALGVRLVHPPPPESIAAARAAVAGRGLESWMASLEAQVLAAGTRRAVGCGP